MLHEPEHIDLAQLPTVDGGLLKWHDAMMALEVCAAASTRAHKKFPAIRLQAKSGPVLDQWLDLFTKTIKPRSLHKLPVSVTMEGLIGGLDLAATLSTGKRQATEGLLSKANGGFLILHACEDLEHDILSTVMQAYDDGHVQLERDGICETRQARFGILIIDGSDPAENAIPEQVVDRTMMHIDLDGVDLRSISDQSVEFPDSHNTTAICGPSEIEAIVSLAAGFGLHSLRPAMQAIEVACLYAGLNHREQVTTDDIEAAIRLSLLNRAKCLPSPVDEPQEPDHHDEPRPDDFTEETDPPEPEHPDETADADPQEEIENADTGVPDEIDVETLLANLPADLLEQLKNRQAQRGKAGSQGRMGIRKYSFKRGRRIGSTRGKPGHGKRLDLIATLRAAAPWQKARKRFGLNGKNKYSVAIRPDDFRIKRFVSKSESTTIFAVDASGSTAINRLGEAKGAIEILLNESYSRRDHVSLVAMRGETSEVILQPSRSLIMAKRTLSRLAGGGGTPLAHGLQAALEIADDERRQGRTATIVVLTDGSANIALDGKPGRNRAHEDAMVIAQAIGASGHPCLMIDVSKLPGAQAQQLAEAARGTCLPMPFASSHNISKAVLEHRQSG